MNNINNFDTDICALASTQGHGAIAVIRTSGKESIKKLDKIFVPGVGKQNGKQNGKLRRRINLLNLLSKHRDIR
jgi:GTP-binding protein TrmE N-terminus.